MKIDAGFLKLMSRKLGSEMARIEKTIYELAGTEFNINSPKQLAEILFVKLELTPIKKTKTGFSTNVDVLEELAHVHPLPAEILKYRTLAKLKSTYVDALPSMINPRTGRLHTSLNQTVTATGRLSSSEPNLQNIPIRTEVGREIRQAFIAERGASLLSADYSQIELRVLAHMSGDPALIQTFQRMKMSIPGPHRRSSGSRRKRSLPRCGARPRRSTSASSTAYRPSAWHRTSASRMQRQNDTLTITSPGIPGCGSSSTTP